MKQFGLYDMKNYEQCVCIGTIREISQYLGKNYHSLWSHLSRKKQGDVKYIHQRYDLVELEGKNEKRTNKKSNNR